jgi:hypothetical protein
MAPHGSGCVNRITGGGSIIFDNSKGVLEKKKDRLDRLTLISFGLVRKIVIYLPIPEFLQYNPKKDVTQEKNRFFCKKYSNCFHTKGFNDFNRKVMPLIGRGENSPVNSLFRRIRKRCLEGSAQTG